MMFLNFFGGFQEKLTCYRISPNRIERTYCQACIFMVVMTSKNIGKVCCLSLSTCKLLNACSQGGRVTSESGLSLAAGQKIARIYKQNFTRRATNEMRGCTQRGLETSRKLTRVGGLTLLECLPPPAFQGNHSTRTG